ncbi:kinase-like protein [Hypoxylon sp. FL0890]|nr:kinase-like protein [Hypoxylon sp. FL0890]
MDRRSQDIIFSLKGSNDRARKAIKLKENRKWASNKLFRENCFTFGSSLPTKDSNPLLTIATLGSSRSKADIYIPGDDIADVNSAFVVNWRTGVVLVENRSPDCTRVYPNAESMTNQMPRGEPHRVAVIQGFNTVLSLGRNERDRARFEFVWNLKPEQTLELIRRRISGASADVQRRCLVNFRGQTPSGENPVYHFPIAELGRGSFGRVWKTVDELSGDFIAVKMLHPPKNPDDAIWRNNMKLAREREVFILSRLKHPHVLPFLGSHGWETGTVQIFFALKKGNLQDLIVSNLPSQTKMEIGHAALVHTLSAIDYLDYMGVVHRDIKPDNILYDIDHQGRYIFQLGDFGLANYQLAAGTGAGSKVFTAPEIVDKLGPQTSAVDIWSLFVTMLWFHNADLFRYKVREMSRTEIRRSIINAAMKNKTVKHIREMGIFDPNYRATAAQMLNCLGRQDLITQAFTPLRPDHFDTWLETVAYGSSPYSNYLHQLFA